MLRTPRLWCVLLHCSLAACATASRTHPGVAASVPGEAPSGYSKPPREILDVLHAPASPEPLVSPTHDRILLVSVEDYPPIARVAAPFLRLAGVRVEPKNHSRHDTPGGYGIPPCATDYTLVRVADRAVSHVVLPPHGCPGRPLWAADGTRFAFQNVASEAVELWVGDAATGAVHQVPGVRLNPMLGQAVQWMPDQRTLLVKEVAGGAAPASESPAPVGPSIQETAAQTGQSSTYETRDTLRNGHDEELFDYYATSQLALVGADTGEIAPIGRPALYDELDPAPDGEHILVGSIHRPYSYVTTYDRFPHEVDIWSRNGDLLHHVASLPLADRVPVQGVPTGPREFDWRATEPATLVWAEALDRGDWNVEVPARDRIMLQKAPFTAPPVEVMRTRQRFVGALWGARQTLSLFYELDENRHWMRTYEVNLEAPGAAPRVLWDLSTDERYLDPGHPVLQQLPTGAWVVRQDGDTLALAGTGSSPEGDRPFLDRFDLKTLKATRLFRSSRTGYERFLAFAGTDGRSFMTWHQSPTAPPNAFLRALGEPLPSASAGEAAYASTATPLTHLPDPTPSVRAIQKRLVRYKRKDGVDLSFVLYLPPGYQPGTRLPTILYAYPLDYADASKAGQLTGSDATFTRLRDYKLLLLAGYAVIDRASFPIVGDPKKAYDTYLEQLLQDAQAAVQKAVELGVADPNRIGVTGHSHGALMTANLVAHSHLFRAGAATSGSYNKTLTPFGFQNERRSVWEAQSVYLKASPFFVADKIKIPLLIVHGEEDANPGTAPLQAVKLYEAIRGNGGTARLVMLPHEPHWYTAMESNEQVISEMLRWFDKYVKNARPEAGVPVKPAG